MSASYAPSVWPVNVALAALVVAVPFAASMITCAAFSDNYASMQCQRGRNQVKETPYLAYHVHRCRWEESGYVRPDTHINNAKVCNSMYIEVTINDSKVVFVPRQQQSLS